MMAHRQTTLLSFSALLLGGILLTGPVMAQDDDSAAGSDAKADAEKSQEEQVEPTSGAEMAESLRQSGRVVSQSGDLKIAVDPQYFAEFPGYDLDHLTSGQHAWLLKQANSIFCTCGCRGDTIARCVVLDPTCQTARQVLDKMASTAGQLSEEELKAAAAADREAAAKQPAN
jgi:hypothetical protein